MESMPRSGICRGLWWINTLAPTTKFRQPRSDGRLIRILIVDDNAAVRHYLRALLEQQSTWRVSDEARTGGDALQRVKNNPPDMILLDFQMPDLNGLDVAREINKMFPEIPILMVTIHLSKQLADEAVDALLHAGTYFPTKSSIES
jgi:DNA-binding NarL/FixJ family response regulator